MEMSIAELRAAFNRAGAGIGSTHDSAVRLYWTARREVASRRETLIAATDGSAEAKTIDELRQRLGAALAIMSDADLAMKNAHDGAAFYELGAAEAVEARHG